MTEDTEGMIGLQSCMSQADCEKAWLNPEEEETMQKGVFLINAKRKTA